MNINFKEFPVTRYQGSKRKIVHWINEIIREVDCDFETVLDGFGGTGSVSYLFKKLGKSVTYNDNLRFNSIIGEALIENNNLKLINNTDIDKILLHQSKLKIVEKQFDGYYFLHDENRWVDNVVEGIADFYNQNKYEAAIAYYALFQACLIKRPFNLFHRKNLYIRTNDVARSFGNKTSWEKPFESLFRKFILEANRLVFDNNKHCISLNKSIFDIDQYGYDLVYLDPPYFISKDNHETSNYQRCYHFLEGLSKYSDWEKIIDTNTKTKRIFEHEQASALTKKNISIKLEELIYKFRKSIIVFSYKEGGTPSIDFIEGLMKSLNKKVTIKSIHYKYALNRQNGNALKNREVLIVAT